MTDLQRAEELIKREMITMLHFDAMSNASANQRAAEAKKTKKVDPSSAHNHQGYLEKYPYEEFKDDVSAPIDRLQILKV